MNVKKYLDKLEDLTGRKVIVTGGTSGIGLSIVKELLIKNAEVVILARNLTKANEVKSKFEEEFQNSHIFIVRYDQSDNQSILDAVDIVVKEHSDFDTFIMNAGIFQSGKMSYVDDIPLTIKTNFVGLKVLLDNLLPKLNKEHRFVFQGSLAAGFHQKKITSLKDKKLSAWQQYIISKSGVEEMYCHYSKLEQNQFSFYLVEPGITSTEIIRDFPAFIRWAGRVFLKVFSHSNDRAALTAMLAVQSSTPKNTYIVPRGLFTYGGLPKIKEFPHKREREYLYDLLGQI